ncbi:MAG: hypothetical protein V4649_06530 [Bacteroidota bacterium]
MEIVTNANTMQITYTARATFDPNDGETWNNYIDCSKLSHLAELVSLDISLNEPLEEIDWDSKDYWECCYADPFNPYHTGLFTSLDYIFRNVIERRYFNLLAAVVAPVTDCKNLEVDGFELLGYDLMGMDYGTSSLTNCGGFEGLISPADVNSVGLIDNYDRAYDIKKRLLENNPGEHHADTNVIALWRHKMIGRKDGGL